MWLKKKKNSGCVWGTKKSLYIHKYTDVLFASSSAGRLQSSNGQFGDVPVRLGQGPSLNQSGPGLLAVLESNPLLPASSHASGLAGSSGWGKVQRGRGSDKREGCSAGLPPAEPATAHRQVLTAERGPSPTISPLHVLEHHHQSCTS